MSHKFAPKDKESPKFIRVRHLSHLPLQQAFAAHILDNPERRLTDGSARAGGECGGLFSVRPCVPARCAPTQKASKTLTPPSAD